MKIKLSAILILLTILTICGCSRSKKNGSIVYLVNQSSKEIISGTLNICDYKFQISHLEKKKEVIFNFTPCSDEQYSVKIKFSSGEIFEKSIGYITWGFNYKDKLIIKDNDIILEAREVINK